MNMKIQHIKYMGTSKVVLRGKVIGLSVQFRKERRSEIKI